MAVSPSSSSVRVRCLRWGASGLIVFTIGSLASRVMNPLPVTALPDSVTTMLYLAALAAATGCYLLAARIPAGLATAGPPPATALAAPSSAPHSTDEGSASAEPVPVPTDSLLKRVYQVLPAGTALVEGCSDFDAGRCIQFAIRADRAGDFAKSTRQDALYELIDGSIDGHWTMVFQRTADTLVFTRKVDFPGLVAPPIPSFVAQSLREAIAHWPDFRLRLGVDAHGEEFAINLRKFPHAVFAGGTGSGKSVVTRFLIEQFRAAGAMIFCTDGKGTDHTNLIGQPNIVAVSQSVPDHLRITKMVADELEARQADAKRIQLEGIGGSPFQRPPILFLIDEYATIKNKVKDLDTDFEKDLEFLTRVGRQFLVFVVLATQELYRDTISGKLLGNIALRISLGPPEAKTIKEAFPLKLQAEATRVGGSISKNDSGRAMAVMDGEDGDAKVVEFQAFYGYSPGDPDPVPVAIQADLAHYRTEVSDRIPKIYPRVWFEVPGPDYGAVIGDLYALPPVLLDGPDGQPDPAATQWDPLHRDYLGASVAALPAIPSLTELADGRTFTPRRPPVVTSYADDLDDDTSAFAADGSAPCNSLYTPPPAPRRLHATDDDVETALENSLLIDAADSPPPPDDADLPWTTDDCASAGGTVSPPPPARRKNTGYIGF